MALRFGGAWHTKNSYNGIQILHLSLLLQLNWTYSYQHGILKGTILNFEILDLYNYNDLFSLFILSKTF